MKPLIMAHCGASGYAPENTLAAFRLAYQMGADGIELDVHFSKDRQVVVTHDDNVKRVTGYQGMVSDLTLEQLKKLDFSNFMAGYKGEQIPTFEEVLEYIKTTNMMINVELKTNHENPNGLEEATHALVQKYEMEDRIIYSSFNHYSLLQMKKVAPHMPCGVLYDEKMAMPWKYAKSLGLDAIHPHFPSINQPDYMENCSNENILCNCWTVNQKSDIEAMLQANVSGIITNYPDVAIALRSQLDF